mgnify:CR=1 FL=1
MTRNKTKYVDGYVLTVPKKRVGEYIKMAREAGKMWMEYGALSYKECRGEDLKPDMQGFAYFPFPKMIKLKPNETVWFSYIEYKSKKHRDEVNRKVTKDMESYQKEHPDHMKDMPWDMKRFAYGGFEVEVGY